MVRDRELERGGAVRVARLLGLLGLLPRHGEGLGVVLVGAGVERLELATGVLLAEGDTQGDRVTDRIAAGSRPDRVEASKPPRRQHER